ALARDGNLDTLHLYLRATVRSCSNCTLGRPSGTELGPTSASLALLRRTVDPVRRIRGNQRAVSGGRGAIVGRDLSSHSWRVGPAGHRGCDAWERSFQFRSGRGG